MKKIDGPFLAPKSGGKAQQLVIFLHGYGSNGDDLLSIGEEWAEHLPDAAFVSPNAPDPCDMNPAFGYQWFAIRAIDRAAMERDKAIETVRPVLDGFIDEQLRKWDIPENRLIVAGFSQGAMMALYCMPRRKKPCAGIIGYSGMLIDAHGLKGEGIVRMPVLAIHGERDEVVPPGMLEGISDGFSSAKFDVETIMRPQLAHSIDQFGLIRGLEFCRECFDIAEQNTAKKAQVTP